MICIIDNDDKKVTKIIEDGNNTSKKNSSGQRRAKDHSRRDGGKPRNNPHRTGRKHKNGTARADQRSGEKPRRGRNLK